MARKFKDPNKFSSFGEIRDEYKRALSELEQCKRERQLAFATSSQDRKTLTGTRAEVKEKQRSVDFLITKSEQAASIQKQSAVSSSVAAFCYTSLFYWWQTTGYPGGTEWEPYFNDALVTAAIMWGLANSVSWLQKIYYATS